MAWAAVFKMESHSHPSAIEPYQGAATGVGGIVRDIISMGARPVALLDPLMFGPLTDARNRWLLEGVVAGIGGYGNCIGVPTVGGEIRFAEPHSANPSVERDVRRHREGGRAGDLRLAHGARRVAHGPVRRHDRARRHRWGSVLASATIEEGSEDSRPSVQIGDPFAEKLLIEASLELVAAGLARGSAGPGRRRDHLRGERVRGPRRAWARVLDLDAESLTAQVRRQYFLSDFHADTVSKDHLDLWCHCMHSRMCLYARGWSLLGLGSLSILSHGRGPTSSVSSGDGTFSGNMKV